MPETIKIELPDELIEYLVKETHMSKDQVTSVFAKTFITIIDNMQEALVAVKSGTMTLQQVFGVFATIGEKTKKGVQEEKK